MVIDDALLAEHYLSHINYYRLAAYWLPFEASHSRHVFHTGVRFEQVLEWYVFDREFRLLVLDAIERIEVSVRTQFAYQLAHRHGAHPHLNAGLFKQDWDYAKNHHQLQNDVKKSKETLPPIWASVEIMTLGQLSNWYAHLSSMGFPADWRARTIWRSS